MAWGNRKVLGVDEKITVILDVYQLDQLATDRIACSEALVVVALVD
jgi:hypothetical protein